MDDLQIRGLQTAWSSLADRAHSHSAAQTYAYARTAMDWVVSDAASVRVVCVWRDESLAAVWPLVLHREGLATVARPLSGGSNEEYSGALVDVREIQSQMLDLIFDAAERLCDVLFVFNLEKDGAAESALLDRSRLRLRDDTACPIISVIGHRDLSSWMATKSKSFRKGLEYDRRKLSERGRLQFATITTRAHGQALVDWLFDRKIEMLGVGKWLKAKSARKFYKASLRSAPSTWPDFYPVTEAGEHPKIREGVVAFALLLNGKFIAACLCLVAETMELFIIGYDQEFSKYSPGNLLLEDCVGNAIRHNLNFDFRINLDPYKLRWADRIERRATYQVAVTPVGALVVAAAAAAKVMLVVRKKVGPMLKRRLAAPKR